jgi:hypothetical protein
MEVAVASKISGSILKTTWHHIPDDHLHVTFEVLVVMAMEITVTYDVILCSLVKHNSSLKVLVQGLNFMAYPLYVHVVWSMFTEMSE